MSCQKIPYAFVLIGMVIIKIGYVRLMLAPAGSSGFGSLAVAVLGFFIATFGFVQFCVNEKRFRFTRRLRSPY